MKLIYKRAIGKAPEQGSMGDVQVGDAVTYRLNNGDRSARVESITQDKHRLRTEAFVVNGVTLRASVTLDFSEIISIHRQDKP